MGYVDPTGRVKVPFFMITGMGPADKQSVFHPISKRIAPDYTPGPNFSSSFNAQKRTGKSQVEYNAEKVLSGESRFDEYERTDEFFWFISDEVPENIPNRIPESLAALRSKQSDVAGRIVLLDFSKTGMGDKIKGKIPQDFANITHIRAEIVDMQDAHDGLYLRRYRIGNNYLTDESFVDHVRAQMPRPGTGVMQPSFADPQQEVLDVLDELMPMPDTDGAGYQSPRHNVGESLGAGSSGMMSQGGYHQAEFPSVPPLQVQSQGSDEQLLQDYPALSNMATWEEGLEIHGP